MSDLWLFMSACVSKNILCFRSEYLFVFNDKFEINDDFEVLKKMGLVLGKIFLYIY